MKRRPAGIVFRTETKGGTVEEDPRDPRAKEGIDPMADGSLDDLDDDERASEDSDQEGITGT